MNESTISKNESAGRIFLAAAGALSCVFMYFYYAGRGVELDPADLIRFLFFVSVFVMPQGWLFLKAARFDFEGQDCTTYERLALCCTAGCVVSSLLCYVTNMFLPSAAYGYLSALFFAVFAVWQLYAAGGAGSALKHGFRRLRSDFRVAAGALALLLVLRFLTVFCYLDSGPDGLEYRQFLVDNRYHVSLIYEMFRGIPMQETPQLSGMPFTRYHFMAHVLTWIPVRYAGADLMDTFHVYMPVLFTLLMAAHTYYASKRLGGGRPFGYAGTVLMFFLYMPAGGLFFLRFARPESFQLEQLYFSYNLTAAMPVALGFAHLFIMWTKSSLRAAPGIAAAVFAAALFLFKANIFIIVFPAFMCVAGISFLRERRGRRAAAAAIAAGIAAFGILFALYSQYPDLVGFKLKYGAYADRIFGSHFSFGPHTRGIVRALPDAARQAATIITAPLLQSGAVNAVLLCVYYLAAPRKIFSDYFRMFGIFFFAALLFVYSFLVDSAGLMNLTEFIPPFVFAFAVFPAVGGLKCIRDRIAGACSVDSNEAGPMTRTKAVARLLCIASVAGSVYVTFVPFGVFHFPLSPDEVEVWEQAEKITPLESVFLGSNYSTGLGTFIGGRRTVVGIEWQEDQMPEEYRGRAGDAECFFRTTDAAEAEKIIERYGIDYVVAADGDEIHFPRAGLLREKYRAGDTAMYRVIRNGGGSD